VLGGSRRGGGAGARLWRCDAGPRSGHWKREVMCCHLKDKNISVVTFPQKLKYFLHHLSGITLSEELLKLN